MSSTSKCSRPKDVDPDSLASTQTGIQKGYLSNDIGCHTVTTTRIVVVKSISEILEAKTADGYIFDNSLANALSGFPVISIFIL